MPALARIVVGEAHVCHCRVGHDDCVCARCHRDVDGVPLSEEAIRGKCGDDDEVPSLAFVRAVPAPKLALVRPSLLVTAEIASDAPPPLVSRPASRPPLPPPRST